MSDLNTNHEILSLCEKGECNRDDQWEQKFLSLFVTSQLTLQFDSPKPGPDQFPYMFALTTASSNEPAAKLIDWLSTRGIGLVVNADKGVPDYVFPYGMLWYYRQTGRFQEAAFSAGEVGQTFAVDATSKLLVGAPSEAYLPGYVRTILREFFRDQGFYHVKVLVASTDGKKFDLCFSLESLGTPPATEHQGILEAISWFLPTHYSLALVHEKAFTSFGDL